MFHKDLMKIFYFPSNSSNIFSGDPCFHATLQKVILLDCHNVTCRILNETLKGLVRLIQKRRMFVIITKNDKYLNTNYFLLFEIMYCSKGTICTYRNQ